MVLTIFGSCLIKKNEAIFVHFSTLMSAIYRIFICVLYDNITSVVLFQNLGNLKTKYNQNTGPCVTKTVTVGFFLS